MNERPADAAGGARAADAAARATAALPPLAPVAVIEPHTCLRCGHAAPGNLRVAIWEEEEKGRLSARMAVLCEACHEGFFAAAFSRVDVARWYHAARRYEPHGWIARIDRDLLLAVTCLECGTILPLGPEAVADEARCLNCGVTNRLRMRHGVRITAGIVPAGS